ncbi:DUF1549 domain-containing protein [Tautonia plasticadhaerens]|uniref:Bacterial Ig-like domain (Group 2) n=1 Tax=Tautonia plasticadhaerens TaxID=2527974 RepID=A0A518H680_9BACT|nr:DUF1549 domain-containing protein [Tautonia plasticadhaerens]QDV36339.1 Bacterial Ig-like domain (group 2) [Tautonia plasticadhaerens]
MPPRTAWQLLALCLAPAIVQAAGSVPDRIRIEPPETVLDGRRATAQLIATGHYPGETVRDLTHEGGWTSSDPSVVAVGPGGRIEPRGDGQAEVIVRLGSSEARAVVRVRNADEAHPIQFAHEVLPALTKAGCNMGACHGTPTGKNGFRLSLRGYDAAVDFQSLAREVGSRRTNPFKPESSLILLKGTGQTPHEGGKRLEAEDVCYRALRDWVAEGVRPDPDDTPELVSLVVTPPGRILDDPAREQQLVVRAEFADGSTRDVTRLARYSTTDTSVASVDDAGRVVKESRGESTVLVSFEHLVAAVRLVFREPVPGLVWADPPENNFIDEHIFEKLKLLSIPPSELSDDAQFCRRVYLDVIGLIPTPEELVAFLEDPRPEKRARLIDELLERPEYVDFWTLKWADLLGCNRRFTGTKGAISYHRWIRDQVAYNVPLDRFVREIITSQGPNFTNPPASFYRRIRSPEDAVESVSQIFMGVRLGCAKCHNHVAERWTQDDYYGMASFFSQVEYKNGPQNFAQYNKEETVYLDPDAEVRQPRTGVVMQPKPLGDEPVDVAADEDRREALADWLVDPANPFFAKAMVNRIWYHLMGRGIVDPVDDFRESNPPASAELLQALADDLVAHGFDAKRAIRLILNSRVYQLSSRPNAFNEEDNRYFSHAMVRLMMAEQMLDSACLATGVPEGLFYLPPGSRAAQVPDGELVHPFLRDFGQPARADACECERGTDTTLGQALQLIGGRTLHGKVIARENRIGALIESGADDDTLVETLFLATLSRYPGTQERELAVSELAARPSDRRQSAEDLLWTLMNHPEFLFQH